MVRHVPVRRNNKFYEDFYCNQAGHGIPVFVGGRNQRGHGLGSFFGGLGRMVLPWLKTGGKALLREGLGTGIQVAQDALAGRNVGESFREHARGAGQRLLQGAVNHIAANQSGSGFRKRKRMTAPPGEPFRKRIKHKKKTARSHSHRKNSSNKYSDIFG